MLLGVSTPCGIVLKLVGITRGRNSCNSALANVMKLPTILLLLSSLPVLVIGIAQIWKGIISKWWPQVSPSDLKFKIIKSSSDDGTLWTPTVVGCYDYRGTSYKLSRIQFGECGVSDESEAQKIIEKYQSDSVSVYVNPSNPKEHVLFPGITNRALVALMLGLFFCLIAVLIEKGILVEGSGPGPAAL
jgi:hypothetical protein